MFCIIINIRLIECFIVLTFIQIEIKLFLRDNYHCHFSICISCMIYSCRGLSWRIRISIQTPKESYVSSTHHWDDLCTFYRRKSTSNSILLKDWHWKRAGKILIFILHYISKSFHREGKHIFYQLEMFLYILS